VDDNGSPPRSYLLFAWSPNGYHLREREGDLPTAGAEIRDDGRALAVVKVGASPFPGDPRRCVYTVGAR
jgi:hypothetical protein